MFSLRWAPPRSQGLKGLTPNYNWRSSFSADATSCSLINQQCWISPRMYCMRYLDDISSLITIACCVPVLRTIEFRPFPIENVPTFAPPSTFSMGNRQNSLAHNSRTQQAIVIKLEISSKYLIQYILRENPGNPTMLIN